MNFNSLIFIYLFLPAVTAGFFLAGKHGRRAADGFLLAAGLVFYAFAGIPAALLLLASSAATFALTDCSRRVREKGRSGKAAFLLALFLNIGLLLFFKYTNFFLNTAGTLLQRQLPQPSILLPLGISFYTFSQLAFCVERYHGKLGSVTFPQYLLYVSYFPKLSQGPIMQPSAFFAQLSGENRMRPDARRFVTAAQMFTLGLAKKLFLADTFAKAAAFGYQNYRNCTTFDVIIVMLSYTLQIYFDFSSYSDMASAVSLMLNIDLPLNFNSPYKAFSVTEFWKRWHISLTDFLRTYVYFPLGGSRKGKLRTYRNIMIVFLISGFWHGANWTFVVWGLLHGAAQCFERIFKKPLSYVPKIIRWFFTFFFVNVAWLLFGASSFEQWRYLTAQLFNGGYILNQELAGLLRIPGLRAAFQLLGLQVSDSVVFTVSAIVLLGAGLYICLFTKNLQERRYRAGKPQLVMTALLLVLCAASTGTVSNFIYSNF